MNGGLPSDNHIGDRLGRYLHKHIHAVSQLRTSDFVTWQLFDRQPVQRHQLTELNIGLIRLSPVGYSISALVIRFCGKVSQPAAESIDGSRLQRRKGFPQSIGIAQLGGF